MKEVYFELRRRGSNGAIPLDRTTRALRNDGHFVITLERTANGARREEEWQSRVSSAGLGLV